MNSHPLTANSCPPALITLLLICTTINGQSTGSIEGQVIDQNNAVVFAARIRASSREILADRSAVTDNAGRYQVSTLPVGVYRVEVTASAFQTMIVDNLRVEVVSSMSSTMRTSDSLKTSLAVRTLDESPTRAFRLVKPGSSRQVQFALKALF